MKLPIAFATIAAASLLLAAAYRALPQSGSAHTLGSGGTAGEELRSQDNVNGLELVVRAGGGVRLFELGPFAPPAQYARHFRHQAQPVRVVLRTEWLGSASDQPFAPAAGASWSLSLPESWFSGAPGTHYRVLAWEAGHGIGDADAAVFSYGVEL